MFGALINAALNYSRTVLSLLVIIIISGSVAYVSIPKEAEPDISFPVIYVSAHLEGISPEDSEKMLLQPLEREMKSIQGVTKMSSTGYLGGGNVVLEFDPNFDSDQAVEDVKSAVDRAKPDLPAEADDPTVNEINISEFPILVVALFGDVPERQLGDVMDQLQEKVEGISSVLEATVSGKREEAIEAIIDPSVLESYNLDIARVAANIANSNALIAAGTLNNISGAYEIKVPGLLDEVSQVYNIPIKATANSTVTVQDVAQVKRTFKDPSDFARINGKPALTLNVSKRAGENIIETIEKVKAIIETEKPNWPEGIEVLSLSDQSSDIRSLLSDLLNNVLAAVLLVMIVIVGALGMRSGFLVGFAIPGSYLIGFLILSALGLTINIVVLFSLILASGMLVDGAIVVVEYADRRLSEGASPLQAFSEAAKRMAWPITTSTLTTLAAFAPLAFWPGLVGEFMKYLPITLLITLSASLLMALIFIPTLGRALTSGAAVISSAIGLVLAISGIIFLATNLPQAPLIKQFFGESTVITSVLVSISSLLFVALIFALSYGIALGLNYYLRQDRHTIKPEIQRANQISGPVRFYTNILKVLIRFPETVLVTVVSILIISFLLYGKFGAGTEFFPSVEPNVANINIRARGDLSIWEKDLFVRQVEEKVLEFQRQTGELHAISTTTQSSSSGEQAEDQIGTILIEFADHWARRPADQIIDDIRRETSNFPGILVEISSQEAGPPQGKAVQIDLNSDYTDKLKPAVQHILQGMSEIGGYIEIEDGLPLPGIEWQLNIDREAAARYGVSITLLGQYVRLITSGVNTTSVRLEGNDEEIDTLVRLDPRYRSLAMLDQLKVHTLQGQVPISTFITREAKPKVGILKRIEAKRTISVKAAIVAELDGKQTNNDMMVKRLETWLNENPLPQDVNYEFVGENQEQAEAQAFLSRAFGVALFMMIVILLTQFNSFYKALLVLSSVVMSTAGVVLGMLVSGQPFVIVMSGVGIIALAGIVVNNNIVLIDTYDTLRREGKSVDDAILLTAAQRFRPVLLTTTTTILGLIPMVTQTNINFLTGLIQFATPSTQWWVALSSAVAYGLAFATLLTLFFTPSMLKLQEDFQARFFPNTADAAMRIKKPNLVIRIWNKVAKLFSKLKKAYRTQKAEAT